MPSEYSYRTGKFLFYVLAEATYCMSLLNAQIEMLIKAERGGILRKVVRNGAEHIMYMLMLLIKNWDAPIFENSQEMKTFVEEMAEA
jgi:hypothetical protein